MKTMHEETMPQLIMIRAIHSRPNFFTATLFGTSKTT